MRQQLRIVPAFIVLCSMLLLTQLTGCSTLKPVQDGAPSGNVDITQIPNAVPKQEAISKYGNKSSYIIHGKRYHVLKTGKGYSKVGFASWYGTKFHKKLTSTRETYNLYAMTAASPELPIPCYAQVTNLSNGKSVIVKVNDRGPFADNRIMDLSYVAARKLGIYAKGTGLVRVTTIDPAQWAAHHGQYPTLATVTPPSSLPSEFYLQVGAFANQTNAESLRYRVAQLTTVPVTIKSGYHNDSAIYRVQVGPLAANESNELREKLENVGLGSGISIIG